MIRNASVLAGYWGTFLWLSTSVSPASFLRHFIKPKLPDVFRESVFLLGPKIHIDICAAFMGVFLQYELTQRQRKRIQR